MSRCQAHLLQVKPGSINHRSLPLRQTLSSPMMTAVALKVADPALEPFPVETIPGEVGSGAIILCDHASNAVPPELGDLGLPAAEFQRHIAYDIGAAAVT